VLMANWFMGQAFLDPQNQALLSMAAQFVAIGYLILLAPAPLHGSQPAMAQTAPPVVAAVVGLLYQLAALFLLFRMLSELPFVAQNAALALWLDWAGLITAVWGGVAAFGTLHAGRLWGYSALHDWGLILMVMAVAGTRSLPLALFLFGLRTISMLTAAAGLSVLEEHAGGLGSAQLRGAGSRLPWNSAAYLLGGLGLAGFPLSAGFTGHWAALQILAESDWRPAAVVLVASGGAIFGYIRLARILFGPLANRSMRRENAISAAMAAAILLLSVGLAFAPQLLDGPVSRMLLAFNG
jgi:NADH:ubiquinone oxidoreductase subunit 2 (subunit N)